MSLTIDTIADRHQPEVRLSLPAASGLLWLLVGTFKAHLELRRLMQIQHQTDEALEHLDDYLRADIGLPAKGRPPVFLWEVDAVRAPETGA